MPSWKMITPFYLGPEYVIANFNDICLHQKTVYLKAILFLLAGILIGSTNLITPLWKPSMMLRSLGLQPHTWNMSFLLWQRWLGGAEAMAGDSPGDKAHVGITNKDTCICVECHPPSQSALTHCVAHHFIGQIKCFPLPFFRPFPSPLHTCSSAPWVLFMGPAASVTPFPCSTCWLRALSSRPWIRDWPPASLVSFPPCPHS